MAILNILSKDSLAKFEKATRWTRVSHKVGKNEKTYGKPQKVLAGLKGSTLYLEWTLDADGKKMVVRVELTTKGAKKVFIDGKAQKEADLALRVIPLGRLRGFVPRAEVRLAVEAIFVRDGKMERIRSDWTVATS